MERKFGEVGGETVEEDEEDEEEEAAGAGRCYSALRVPADIPLFQYLLLDLLSNFTRIILK